ncbi:DedA family protein [Actinoplanes bogorensis]|uniref:DedA family protein n=1 Tax=Paractinoplanes bogorensis TaxID=1610840 RepID=A0ABS5YIN9_9ACTN|nr:DedA family protein [Actinoplanes bogorensis]MBU2662916.1 DedA family protein [Actinoplanes bogorensis]
MTELLTMMATPAWAYLALFGFLAVDAMIPVVPIQAIMITSGALTVYGNLDLALVIAVGALGMFTGDTIAFVLGRSSGDRGAGRLAALRAKYGPKHDDDDAREISRTKQAAARFTRGLRRPGPLVLLLCRFVPGGRMAAGFYAGRRRYPIKLFVLYDGLAALAWGSYGGLVGHVGGTAITQSAWRLFAIAATAAVVFGTAGWILALFGGRKDEELQAAAAAGYKDVTAARAASADAPLPRSTPTTTGR